MLENPDRNVTITVGHDVIEAEFVFSFKKDEKVKFKVLNDFNCPY